MRVKVYRWIAMHRISLLLILTLATLVGGNSTDANAQTRQDVRLVLQIS